MNNHYDDTLTADTLQLMQSAKQQSLSQFYLQNREVIDKYLRLACELSQITNHLSKAIIKEAKQ